MAVATDTSLYDAFQISMGTILQAFISSLYDSQQPITDNVSLGIGTNFLGAMPQKARKGFREVFAKIAIATFETIGMLCSKIV